MWIFISLLNTITAVILSLQLKNLHNKGISSLQTYFISSFITLIIVGVCAFIFNQKVLFNFRDINILIVGLSNFFASVFYIEAYKEGKLSFLGPIENSRPLFVAILSAILLSTQLTVPVITGVILIISGGYLISKNGKEIVKAKTLILCISSVILYSFNTVFAKRAMDNNSVWVIALESLIITIILSIPLLIMYKDYKISKLLFDKDLILRGSILSLGYITWVFSLNLGSAVGITAILMLRGSLVMLYGYLFLKEKVNIIHLAGLVLLTLGAVLSVL